MKYRGIVNNGVVILDDGANIENGTPVEVEIPIPQRERPTLAEVFQDVIGAAVDLPEDLSENHDHYLYGLPKSNNR